MEDYQREFIRFIFERGALKFGEFTTKSGRKSPYFFNAGGLHTGADLIKLGSFYGQALNNHFKPTPDIIYGPAYKGVPLSVVTASALCSQFQAEVSYCFNRKEAKDHGEKGTFVGKVPQKGDSLVIVDDVMTAGTSVRETLDLLKPIEGLNVQGILVALDRQERGLSSTQSALDEIRAEFGLKVQAIVSLEHIFTMLNEGGLAEVPAEMTAKIKAYRDEYGTSPI
ncbi:MAG: orotate phosphoribosyltransferase [Planctomycetes bacterium]|nr:orotate phosphoribosyltransferase [Planctomycetota bacterium]